MSEFALRAMAVMRSEAAVRSGPEEPCFATPRRIQTFHRLLARAAWSVRVLRVAKRHFDEMSRRQLEADPRSTRGDTARGCSRTGTRLAMQGLLAASRLFL
jgi:hypothetical protein